MQIHEITLIQEGVLGTIGNDIKRAVTAPFQKAKHMLNTPGSFTSARGEADARDKYYTELVGKRQQADLGAWAKNLAGEWSKQPRPSSQTPVSQAPVTQAAPKPTVATTTAPTPATTAPGYGPAYKNVTSNPPAAVPNTSTGLPQPTVAKTPTATTTPTTATVATPAVAKPRTGGKQPGVVSQTPDAIRKRNTRARGATAPGQNAFGQMAQTLSGANKSKSSTGGTTSQMPTGRVHTANPNATTPAATQATAAKPAPKWLTPTTKMTKSAPGKPTADEYEKLQQRIAAADAKQRGVTNEAFADLPGAKPAAGGAVAPAVTAKPAGIKAPPPLQSRYAQNFKSWVTSKVADKSSGLGLTDVEKMPEMTRALNQALARVVTTQQNPNDNIAAVEQYLLIVGQAMQKLSAEQKATQQNNPNRQMSTVTPLSSIVNNKQIDALKKMGKTSAGKWDIINTLELK